MKQPKKGSNPKETTITKSNKKNLKKLLDASYDSKKTPKGFTKDTSLSGKRVSVFNDDARTYVVHRGTANLKDWFTDFQMALGFENGSRFRHSEKIQQKAEQKYGSDRVVTLGHSLGGRIAEKVGRKSQAIVTYNKATTPRSIIESYIAPNKKQHDIRTTNDIVSLPSLLQHHHNSTITLDSHTANPLKAHNLDSITK